MTRYRIVHLITELDTGGAQKALARLLAGLSRDRFTAQVACLYNGDKPIAREIRAADIPVTDLGMTAKWRADALLRLCHLLHRERPTILHTWMFHANLSGRLLGRLTGVPIIITSRRNVNIGGAWRERLLRWTSGMDSAVIAVCELARQRQIERANVPPEHVITIYNGVDVTEFASPYPTATTSVRRDLGIPKHTSLVGFVGRLHPQKDLPTLLEALVHIRGAIPKVHLLLVGDGTLQSDLTSRARALAVDDTVTFAGHRTDIPEILSALDLFALPSLWEGLPNAVLEAMAAGLPVVATRVGGVPELVVHGQTGLLVRPADPEALSDAIISLLRDPDRRRQMGQAGQARVRDHFSVERMVEQTEALYERLLREKGIA